MTIDITAILSPSKIRVGGTYNFLIRTNKGLEDVRGTVLEMTITQITIKIIEE